MKFEELAQRISEAFDPNTFNLIIGKTPVSLLIGRFNPWHKGHNELAEQTKYKDIIIGLVKGASTKLDKERNPFEIDLQKEIIQRANVELLKKGKNIADIIEIPAANIPLIISLLRDRNYEPKELLCGTDRAPNYARQVSSYAPPLHNEMKLKVLDRDEEATDVTGLSATKVRQAIKDGKYLAAKDMMVNLDEPLFMKLYQQITQNLLIK